MPLLVHGIIEADAVDASASAVDASDDVELVVHDAVAAVVRATPDLEAMPSRANLLAHTGTLEALAAVVTVLPMRFGVVVDDEHTLVAEYLAPQQDELVSVLERLRGHVELRLRGRYDEDTVLREIVADDPGVARLRGRQSADAKMRLGERIVASIEARRARDLDRVSEGLGPHVAGVVAGGVAEPLDAFSLSLLVAQESMTEFDRAVDVLGQDLAPALALELVGPLPPFSFTTPEGASA